MPDEAPILRPAARVILLDPADRILLIRAVISATVGEFWLTPGGGLGRGETFEAGALRELWEETGISGVELGPCVWTRTQVFPWDDKVYKQQERYFVVRVDEVEVHGDNWTEVEREVLVEHRW